MNTEWENQRKFDIAKEILITQIDSLEKSHPKVEIALRVFGHQHDRLKKNCQDSKLELPFQTISSSRFESVIDRIQPKGYTPLAFSLAQAVNDFPPTASNNFLVLISDGIESCEGNPCEASQKLVKAKLNYRPFIVGLGIEVSFEEAFNCIGTYISAKDKESYQKVLSEVINKSIIEQVALDNTDNSNTPTTSFQLHMLDESNNPTVTGIEYSLYNSHVDSLMLLNIHSQSKPGLSDSIKIYPGQSHELIIHTVPPIVISHVDIRQGQHNVVEQKLTTGQLGVNVSGYGFTLKNKVLIRDPNTNKIVHIQQFQETSTLRTGYYNMEVLTYPTVRYDSVLVETDQETIIQMDRTGTLSLSVNKIGYVTIYNHEDGWNTKVYDFHETKGTALLELIPGKYDIVYRPKDANSASYSQVKHFEITSGKLTKIEY